MPTITRRQLLRSAFGSTTFIPFIPTGLADLIAAGWQQAADPIAERRAQMGAAPIVSTRLADNLSMLSGPGGNVIVLNGPDGKLVVDSFVQPAWPALKQVLNTMGKPPVKLLIDTHWHFDHTDNNEHFRKAGAAILAQVNTKKRMSETHDVLGMHFTPSPAAALPTQTFVDKHTLRMNGERVEAGRIPPAHTDTDAYVHFTRANALHMGDVFFNGVYPFIDVSTGGSINGQIAGATLGLKLSDNATKIVPGHGPVADRTALTAYRDMLVTVRDRVQKLKASGRSLAEVTAAMPIADLDAIWGKGFMKANDFLAIVYNTLRLK
jgi:glyoxylase-like metal-dependent hydrolase (beta-lactamase superfamily II)